MIQNCRELENCQWESDTVFYFSFFTTYELALWAIVLDYIRLRRLAHSWCVRCKAWNFPIGIVIHDTFWHYSRYWQYDTKLHSTIKLPLVIWDCICGTLVSSLARILDYIRLIRVARDKHSSNIHGVFDVRLKILLSELLFMMHSDIILDTDNKIQNCTELVNCQ
jgi:hypothetical protein